MIDPENDFVYSDPNESNEDFLAKMQAILGAQSELEELDELDAVGASGRKKSKTQLSVDSSAPVVDAIFARLYL